MHKYNIPINKKKIQVSKIDVIVIGAAFFILVLALGDGIRPWIAEQPAITDESVNEVAVDLVGDDFKAVEDSAEDDDALSISSEADENQRLAVSGIDRTKSISQPTVLSQTSNGVEMTVSNFRRDGEYIKVDICYDMPDKSDWMLDLTTTLTFGGEQVPRKGLTNLEWKQAAEGQMGYRCDAVRFEVPAYADNAEFTLNIPQISAYPREGEVCDFYLHEVQPELNARGSGIIINCNPDAVQYGMGITIETKPSEMSVEEAMQLVMSDEFYSLPGLWEFTFSLGDDQIQLDTFSQPTVLTQTSNGVEITVSNFRREDELIKVDICYDMPDASDWMFDNTTMLMFGGEQVSLSGLYYYELRHPDTEGQNGYRCGDIEFRNVPVYADNEEFRLIINQIVGPPSEIDGCDFYLNRVQRSLDAQNSGIKISCNPEEMWLGIGITVESKPDSMSIAEAEQLVFSQEHYAFHGLWEFTFRLEQ